MEKYAAAWSILLPGICDLDKIKPRNVPKDHPKGALSAATRAEVTKTL